MEEVLPEPLSHVQASSDDATWEARLSRDMTRSASDPPPLLGAGSDVVDADADCSELVVLEAEDVVDRF